MIPLMWLLATGIVCVKLRQAICVAPQPTVLPSRARAAPVIHLSDIRLTS